MYYSGIYEKRKLKVLLRKQFSTLSSDDANALVLEYKKIHETIYTIANKSFGGNELFEYEQGYVDSLPLEKKLKKDLWQGAMFAQFR
ncbi:hypothetical protein MNBD_GAMMA12-3959 [hydrothermal vent metagenome]|uniref:Uncharacterized protein n=1 Tax=hydrothermal vent metagenome TaxID=652676 RepID=A0A3B0ZII6_9ZZZZ